MSFGASITLFSFILFFTASAAALPISTITLNASAKNVGEDASDLPGATLSYYTHDLYADTVSYNPALISADSSYAENVIGGATAGNHWPTWYHPDGFSPPENLDPFEWGVLDEIGRFSGLSLTSDQGRIINFGFTGFSDTTRSGDTAVVYLFGKSGNLLNGDIGSIVGGSDSSSFQCPEIGEWCSAFSYNVDLSNQAVFEIRFGSYDAVSYITDITYTAVVPEAAPLALLGLSLAGLGVTRRKTKA